MRLVLIAIEDNDEADAFIEAVKKNQIIVGRPEQEDGAILYRYKELPGATAEGLWAAPTKFCECVDYPGRSATSKAYKWYVHAKEGCMKPRRGAQQTPRNLIEDVNLHPRDRRYSLSFMADRSSGWSYTAGQDKK